MSEIDLAPILELLDSPEEQVRLQGARRLAGLGTPEAIEALRARGAGDSSAAVRHFVRKALAVLDIRPEEEGAPLPGVRRATGTTGQLGSSFSFSKPSGIVSPLEDADGSLEPQAPLTPQLSPREVERLQRAGTSILRPCVQLLIENLEHHDLGVASEAAAALGKMRATEATDRLLELLRAGGADQKVPLAIGEMGDARALGLLVRIFREDPRPEFKEAVVAAVAKIKAPASEDFLKSALESNDPALVTAVARVMAETANPLYAEWMLDRFGRVDEFVQMAMIQAVGRLAPGHPKVVTRFTALLRSEVNPRKLASLLMALARTRDPRLVDTLEPFTSHRDRRVRANAVEAISALDVGDPVKMRILRPMLQDPDNRVRANACITLGRMGERRALDTLVAMLSDPGKWQRASACYAIGVLRPPDGAAFLMKGLRDADPAVRVNAAKGLRELGDPTSAQTLISAVNDRNTWIRLYAIEALGHMRVRAANARLRACLKQETNHQVLASALLAVARTGTADESTRALVDFLKHEDSRVRANAIEALELIGTRESLARIGASLRDPDHRVRANAVKAIWRFGELRVVSTLHAMLSSERTEERRSAAYALGEIGTLQSNLSSAPGTARLVRALQEHPAYASA